MSRHALRFGMRPLFLLCLTSCLAPPPTEPQARPGDDGSSRPADTGATGPFDTGSDDSGGGIGGASSGGAGDEGGTGGEGGDDEGGTGGAGGDPTTGSGGSGGPIGTGTATVGAVSYAYHVPACAVAAGPSPVLFTQHGQGGTGAGMVTQWTSLADAECFIVIGQGSQSGNGWNFNTDVEGLGTLLEEVEALWDIDTDRRILHGYSAGAHWGYVVGLANSATFGGLIVYAGAMNYAESYGVWPDGTQGSIPVAIGHGTADTVVPYAYAQQAEGALSAAGWPVELWAVEGGSHAYDRDHQAAAWAFVMAHID